jgi:hypothetical protein
MYLIILDVSQPVYHTSGVILEVILSKKFQHNIGPTSNHCVIMTVSRCAQGKIDESINQMNLLLSTTVSNAQPCSFQTKVYCLLNHFGVFSHISSSIHYPMQELLYLICTLVV